MFPLRDSIRSRNFPIVNWILIVASVLVFLLEQAIEFGFGEVAFERFLTLFSLVPSEFSLLNPFAYIPIFTSMFLHGGWFHLISNMWILFIFGDNVEDRMGRLRYLIFYLVSGFAAGLTHVVFSSNSNLPTVGASGAIAGVLGAYMILFPRARVVTLIPLFILPWFVEIPAIIYLGVWFLSQISSGLLSIGAMTPFGGIAWWAHIGGFLFGLLLVRVFAPRPKAYVFNPPDYPGRM
ncbi:MAG: rhomboid family intramembrane serine protease [Anaerolineales bacterium]|jgi:membrane associated rhomboid family serine protease